jgi:hypothetical protein
MRRLVLHHRYSEGVAWDLSGYNNHGRIEHCDPGSGVSQGSLGFHQPDSRIDVAPSETLRHLGAFRCSVRFYLQGDGSARYNLVESELSFAFFIESGLELAATVLDINGNWTGAFSSPNTVAPEAWHRADCGHDGISTSWVALDGNVVMTNSNVPGPVRAVGPKGLTIGHWPEPPNQYAFLGYLSEVWLWQTRPDPLADQCCAGPEDYARLSANARARGWTYETVQDTLDEVEKLAAGVAQKLPPDAQQVLANLALRLALAVRGSAWSSAAHLIDQLVALVAPYLSQADQQAALEAILEVFKRQGYDQELLGMAVHAIFCAASPSPPSPDRGTDRGDRGWPKPGTPPSDDPFPSTPKGQKPKNTPE